MVRVASAKPATSGPVPEHRLHEGRHVGGEPEQHGADQQRDHRAGQQHPAGEDPQRQHRFGGPPLHEDEHRDQHGARRPARAMLAAESQAQAWPPSSRPRISSVQPDGEADAAQVVDPVPDAA